MTKSKEERRLLVSPLHSRLFCFVLDDGVTRAERLHRLAIGLVLDDFLGEAFGIGLGFGDSGLLSHEVLPVAFAIFVSVEGFGFSGLDVFDGIIAVALAVLEHNRSELRKRLVQDFESEALDEVAVRDGVAVMPVSDNFGHIDVNDILEVFADDFGESLRELRIASVGVVVLVGRSPSADGGGDDFHLAHLSKEFLDFGVIHMRMKRAKENKSV